MDLFEFMKKKYGEAKYKKLITYLAAIGAHEGLGSRTQMQIATGNNKSHGFGLYQMEKPTFETLLRQRTDIGAKNYGSITPDPWVQSVIDVPGLKAADLGKREQGELLMSSWIRSTRDKAYVDKFLNDEITAGELGAAIHKRSFTSNSVGSRGKAHYISVVNKEYNALKSDPTLVNSIVFDDNYRGAAATDPSINFQHIKKGTLAQAVDRSRSYVADTKKEQNDIDMIKSMPTSAPVYFENGLRTTDNRI